MTSNLTKLYTISNWRWIVISYCYFVIFHLTPTLTAPVGEILAGTPYVNHWGQVAFFRLAFVCVALFAVSVYIGWKSEGFTVFEPAVAAVLYLATILILFPSFGNVPAKLMNVFFKSAEFIFVFVFAFSGAAVGEWMQRRATWGIKPLNRADRP